MTPHLRLAYLLSRYPAINHTYLAGEVAQLRARGVEVHVASVLPPDRPLAQLTPQERCEAAETFYIRSGGFRGSFRPHLATLFSRPLPYLKALLYALSLGRGSPAGVLHHLFYFLEAVVLGRWMLAHGLGHVHIHYSSGVGLFLPRVFPVTISNTFHGYAEFQNPESFHLGEKISASLFVRAISIYGRSQLMLAAHPASWSKIEVVRLGVDLSVFRPAERREDASPCEIVSVGRLSPEKGQHVLLGALERVVRDGTPVRLRLVGDGPSRAELERRADAPVLAGCVAFEGWASPERVRELYAQADIFALPSFAEGIPVVLMEAMAMALPTVATRITGIPELIRDGVEGLLVTPSDEEELAGAIRTLARDAALRRRLGEAGRRRVLEEYDFARNAALLADVFERRLSLPSASRNHHA